jgi:hypothetical protein
MIGEKVSKDIRTYEDDILDHITKGEYEGFLGVIKEWEKRYDEEAEKCEKLMIDYVFSILLDANKLAGAVYDSCVRKATSSEDFEKCRSLRSEISGRTWVNIMRAIVEDLKKCGCRLE